MATTGVASTALLKLYKPLWGHVGDFALACAQASAEGFAGIEGPAPASEQDAAAWRALLTSHQLDYIAEISTAGGYVPQRNISLQGHVDDFERKLKASLFLEPLFVSCLGGCDAWPEEQSIAFFESAMTIAERHRLSVSFETHRSRSFFNPWVTERICRALPQLRLTCDFSHWCVVCERLFDAQLEQLERVFEQAYHIHARVGYDQGPQVPDPTAALYAQPLAQHEQWWRCIWQRKLEKSELITVTPEFGPDGYQAVDSATGEPIGDLWSMNCWMAARQRQQFQRFQQQAGRKQAVEG